MCVCVLQAVVDGFDCVGTRAKTRACSDQLQYRAHTHTHQQVSGSPLSVFWKKLPAIARLHDCWMTSLCSGHGLDTVRRDRAVWHVVWWAVRHLVQLLLGAILSGRSADIGGPEAGGLAQLPRQGLDAGTFCCRLRRGINARQCGPRDVGRPGGPSVHVECGPLEGDL